MSHSGRMPAPIKIGGAVRWNRAEIESWVAAGCPAVDRRGVRRT
jgi:predicted DNA-binding transcriptional regulator AlpA